MDVGVRMATPLPDHILMVRGCIRRVPVRILAAAATSIPRNLEFNPIMKGTTLQLLRNLRLYMMRSTILVQKLPPQDLRTILVTNTFDFIFLPY